MNLYVFDNAIPAKEKYTSSYITFSENLVDEVVKRCSTFSHTNIEFHSLKSLINKIFNRKFDCTFENIETFKSFVKLYSIQSNNIDYVKRDKLIKFINNNDIFKTYSEIYGLIMGYMLNEWNRTSIEYISLNEYKNSIKDYSLFEEEKDGYYQGYSENYLRIYIKEFTPNNKINKFIRTNGNTLEIHFFSIFVKNGKIKLQIINRICSIIRITFI